MLKKILKIVVGIVSLAGMLNAAVLNHNVKSNGYDITIGSQKSLTVGNNTMFVSVKQNGKIVKDIKTKIKVFMPEMPGMPYMEYKAYGKFNETVHKMDVNFGMGGTWQYKLYFKTKSGKKFSIRNSVNI